MQKGFLFTLSGIVSFSFYILICFLFVYYITVPKAKTYTIQSKQTVIELDMIEEISDKKRVEKKEDKKIEKPIEKLVKKATSKTIKKAPDLKSLFGKVKTKEKKIVKQEVNNVVKTSNPKRFISKFEKEKKSSNLKIDSILNDDKTTTTKIKTNLSKGKESNKYYSKIDALLSKWIPTSKEVGVYSKVIVSISKNGKFSYRFDKYSGNDVFDKSLKEFLEEQKSIIYPKPMSKRTVRVGVNFGLEGK